MKLTKQSKQIADAVTIALVLISLVSFVLSYHSLVVMATQHGLPEWLAWLWPLCLDLFMITACLTVIRFQMLKAKTIYPWAVVILTTFASLGFNVASVYSTGDPLTMAMYAVPPLTVFISLELLLMIIKVEQRPVSRRRTTTPRTRKTVVKVTE